MAGAFLAAAQLLGIVAYGLICRDGYHYAQRLSAVIAAAATTNPATAPPALPFRYLFRLSIDTAATRLCAGLYLLLYGVGQWLLAGDEGRHPDKLSTYRWACRITAIVDLTIGLYVLLAGGEFLFKLALLSSTLATFAYLRKLAQRIPYSLLVRICGIICLGPLLTLLKTMPIFLYLAISDLSGIIEFLPLIYLPVTAVLLVWFARIFARCAASATEGWAKETAV
jgi:hypothetical protein